MFQRTNPVKSGGPRWIEPAPRAIIADFECHRGWTVSLAKMPWRAIGDPGAVLGCARGQQSPVVGDRDVHLIEQHHDELLEPTVGASLVQIGSLVGSPVIQ